MWFRSEGRLTSARRHHVRNIRVVRTAPDLDLGSVAEVEEIGQRCVKGVGRRELLCTEYP